ENARDLLRANPHIADEVEAKLRAKLANKPIPLDAVAPDADEDGPEEPPAAASPKRKS
ncbi:MAG: DNA recombination/repair protein RecA, partial [Deltaproteobacteria bacterium]|nr:DNA recombination/repair protein RecA [Deltaproteobacteria bacterium]